MKVVKEKTEYLILKFHDRANLLVLELKESTVWALKKYDKVASRMKEEIKGKSLLEVEESNCHFLDVNWPWLEEFMEDEELDYAFLESSSYGMMRLVKNCSIDSFFMQSLRFYGDGIFEICMIEVSDEPRIEPYVISTQLNLSDIL